MKILKDLKQSKIVKRQQIVQITSLLEFNGFGQFSKQLLTALISFTLKTVSFVILDNNDRTSKSTLILTGPVLCGTHQSSLKKL